MLEAAATDYLRDVLGVDAQYRPWDGVDKLPPVLRQRFRFVELEILNLPYLLVIDDDGEELTPARIRKQLDSLPDGAWQGGLIYVAPRMKSWNRRRLIEYRIAFIVPGNQLYLPPLGLDLREHFRRSRKQTKKLSPSTQLLLLRMLTPEKPETHSVTWASEELNYTTMTIRRAFDELESIGVAEANSDDRETSLELTDGRCDTWERALPFLKSPVQRVVLARRIESGVGVVAGESALASYSMLGEPKVRTFAMGRQSFRTAVEEGEIDTTTNQGEAVADIQVWHYAPTILARDGIVDRFSLYLSILEIDDPRVEMARDELLGDATWS